MMAGRITSGRNAGACTGCGMHDATSAPDSCTRCAFEWAVDRGLAAVDRGVLQGPNWQFATRENLETLLAALDARRIVEGSYYVWVADETNLLRPLNGGDPGNAEYVHTNRRGAESVTRQCMRVFPSRSAWVVTYHGIWKLPYRA